MREGQGNILIPRPLFFLGGGGGGGGGDTAAGDTVAVILLLLFCLGDYLSIKRPSG